MSLAFSHKVEIREILLPAIGIQGGLLQFARILVLLHTKYHLETYFQNNSVLGDNGNCTHSTSGEIGIKITRTL